VSGVNAGGVYAKLAEALRRGAAAFLVTAVEAPDPSRLGVKALFEASGGGLVQIASTLPAEWEGAAAELAHRRFRETGKSPGQLRDRANRRTAERRVTLEKSERAPGVTFSVEAFLPRPRLVIAGGGHIAVPVHEIAAIAGFAVTVLDDRPEYARPDRFPRADRVLCDDFAGGMRKIPVDERTSVVVVTRGHLHDLDVLRAIAGARPAYVGVIGSRRRALTVLGRLRAEGYPEEFVDRIHSPIGLDIGAETPEEIALAIVAEVVCALRGGSGGHLSLGPALRKAHGHSASRRRG